MNATLPTIPKKQFTVSCNSTNQRFTLVPFTQGQQAILLESASLTDSPTDEDILRSIKERLEAVRQVINECVVSPDIDVGTLPSYVVEELFLHLRSQSIGEQMLLDYTCRHMVDDAVCGNKIRHRVDITEIKVSFVDEIIDTFTVYEMEGDDTIAVKFKHVSVNDMMLAVENGIEDSHLMAIESISSGDNVYLAADSSIEALKVFFDDIPNDKSIEIKEQFFDKIPTIEYSSQIECDQCKFQHKLHLKGLSDFFQ